MNCHLRNIVRIFGQGKATNLYNNDQMSINKLYQIRKACRESFSVLYYIKLHFNHAMTGFVFRPLFSLQIDRVTKYGVEKEAQRSLRMDEEEIDDVQNSVVCYICRHQ